MKYKVGDKVELINTIYCGDMWKNGTIHKIHSVEGHFYYIRCRGQKLSFREHRLKLAHTDPIIKSMLEVLK